MDHPPSAALKFLNSRHKKRRPRTSFFVELVGRGNLNCEFMLLIFLVNTFFIFLLEYRLEYHLAEKVHRSGFNQDPRVPK